MPKKIEPAVKERAVRRVLEHRAEYPTMTAAVLAVARQEGIGKESLRRWVAQAEVDSGQRPGVSTEESEQVKALKAENRRPGGDHRVSLPPRQARSRAEHARDRTVRPGPDGAASGPGSRSRAQRAPAQDRLLTRWAWPGPRPGRGSGGAHRPAWRTRTR